MDTERITRCPHCGSVFRLRPEQLQQAQGWLRCGQCQQAFDASGRVLAWHGERAPEPDRAQLPQAGRLALDDLLRTEDRGQPELPAQSAQTSTPPQDELLAFEQALASFPLPELSLPATWPAPEQELPEEAHDEVMAAAAAPRRSRTAARAALALLALALALQLAWAMRALWAVHWPGLGQGAQALCERLACALPPWREPRALVLEHARLLRTETGFALQWRVRNAAAWPLRTPAMELTLLDAQEQVLVRRVLPPAEGQLPPVLAAQQPAQGHLAWSWPVDVPVAGYRLLAFYP